MPTTSAVLRDRASEAELLWANGHQEGALILILVAVSAAARHLSPRPTGDRESFERFMKRFVPAVHLITSEIGGRVETLATGLYKHLRCQLIHEGHMRAVTFIDEPYQTRRPFGSGELPGATSPYGFDGRVSLRKHLPGPVGIVPEVHARRGLDDDDDIWQISPGFFWFLVWHVELFADLLDEGLVESWSGYWKWGTLR
jgi:hypothetical protein